MKSGNNKRLLRIFVFFLWGIILAWVIQAYLSKEGSSLSTVFLALGVILVFTLSIFPQDNPVLRLLPFCSPYQTFAAAAEHGRIPLFMGVCAAETAVFGLSELVYQKLRRCLS